MDKLMWLMKHGMLLAEGEGSGEGGGSGAEGAGTGTEGAGTGTEGAQQTGLPNDPESLQKIIHALRKENGDERVAAKQKAAEEARNEMVQQIGKILGLVDEKPTIESLAEQIKALQEGKGEEEKQAPVDNTPLIELAIFKTAKEHGANAERLTDSLSFLAKVKDLDPTADDFQAKVLEAAKQAVEKDPSLKVAGSTASAVDTAGGSGEKTKNISIESAVGAALSGK